jgi:cyclophilin family peptidyl-prolyl cis-trans isomerase
VLPTSTFSQMRGEAVRPVGFGRQLWATLLVAAALALLGNSPASAADNQPRVRVTTNMGSFVIAMDPQRAPLTVANFLRYVDEGFYNGTLFHRVVGNFVIQGGGHSVDGQLKPTHESIANESGNGLRNERGTVGLARAGGAHSGNAQFYINIANNPDLDPLPTRWGYAVFGRVIEGLEVIDRIGTVATGSSGPFKSEAPLKPIVIEKVERLDAKPAAP